MTNSFSQKSNFSGRKILPLFFFIFLILPFVSAAPPVFSVEENTNGYQIFQPEIQFVPQYADFKLHIHVSNISNGLPIPSTDLTVDCFVHLYGPDGNHTMESAPMGRDSNGQDWDIFIDGGNFSDLGEHSFIIWCNSTLFGGESKGGFEVTPAGFQSALDSSNFKLFIILMIVSISLFILAYFLESEWLVFLSGIIWILTGMYGMIYGIGNLSNLYTQAISVVFLVTGFVFILGSIYNLTQKEDD